MTKRRAVKPPPDWPVPSGRCECGCGEPTAIAQQTRRERDQYAGYPLRYLRGHNMRGVTGDDHPRWTGGRHRRRGYVMVRLDLDGADGDVAYLADAKGYAPEHRVVMARHLGRRLRPDEHVHHRDEDRSNNDLANLELVSAAEHNRHHRTGVRHTAATKAKIAASQRRRHQGRG